MLYCVVIRLSVAKNSEKHFFQVNIPADAGFIADVQAISSGLGTPLNASLMHTIATKNVTGRLSLQSPGISDLCYNCLLTTGSSSVEALLPATATGSEVTALFAHAYYDNDYGEIPRSGAIESYTLYGCYEDVIGKELGYDAPYAVSLYLWIKSK